MTGLRVVGRRTTVAMYRADTSEGAADAGTGRPWSSARGPDARVRATQGTRHEAGHDPRGDQLRDLVSHTQAAANRRVDHVRGHGDRRVRGASADQPPGPSR